MPSSSPSHAPMTMERRPEIIASAQASPVRRSLAEPQRRTATTTQLRPAHPLSSAFDSTAGGPPFTDTETISVPTFEDGLDENDETFTLSLSIGTDTANGTILDDDNFQQPALR